MLRSEGYAPHVIRTRKGERRLRKLIALAVAGAVAAAVAAVPASATHSWNGYHWARTANPFTLKLGDNVSTYWDGNLSQTSSDWSKSSVLDTTIVAAGPGKCSTGVSGTVQVCNKNYQNTGWLGLATIWIQSGGHITAGTVKVNDYYLGPSATYTYNNAAEREHVMCQEVGHTFGLDHQSTSGSSLNTCMDYYHNTSGTDLKSTTPNQHDYDELAIIYKHLDSTTTIGAKATTAPVPIGGFDEGGTPRGASAERGNWYVADLGAGRMVLVHVYWAR